MWLRMEFNSFQISTHVRETFGKLTKKTKLVFNPVDFNPLTLLTLQINCSLLGCAWRGRTSAWATIDFHRKKASKCFQSSGYRLLWTYDWRLIGSLYQPKKATNETSHIWILNDFMHLPNFNHLPPLASAYRIRIFRFHLRSFGATPRLLKLSTDLRQNRD